MEVTESVFVELADGGTEPAELEVVEAEFVDASAIRRAPHGTRHAQPPTARVSMDLERWLEVDHQLHELYSLVEIAIMQRDDARTAADAADAVREVMATRLREWKTYARSLEERLHETQIENLELSFALKQTAAVAKEALATPPFARSRRRSLRDRLSAVSIPFT